MTGKYPFEVMSNYPNLDCKDKEVWDRFIRKYPDRFDTVDYDVHVGSVIETPEEPESKMSEQWNDLTRKTIDVIGWKNNSATIIEVRNRFGLATLGQVLGYHVLYHRDNPDVLLKPPLTVCSFIDQDVSYVLDNFGILHEVF